MTAKMHHQPPAYTYQPQVPFPSSQLHCHHHLTQLFFSALVSEVSNEQCSMVDHHILCAIYIFVAAMSSPAKKAMIYLQTASMSYVFARVAMSHWYSYPDSQLGMLKSYLVQ